MRIKNPNIEVVGIYINADTKILHRCLIDGFEWEAKPSNILSGTGCPKCGGHYHRTQDQFISELKQINPNIELVGEYINTHTRTRFRCLIDDFEWESEPSHILLGRGCSVCAGNKKKTHDEFVSEIKEKNPNIEVIGRYTKSSNKIKCRCLLDGFIWDAYAEGLIKGHGCPVCAGNIKKTHAEYVKEIQERELPVKVIGEYVNTNTPIKHECLIHKYVWDARPAGILSGHGCPQCKKEACARHPSRYTQEKYESELKKKNPGIEAVGKYVNFTTDILHRCLVCGHEWYARPGNVLCLRRGCPQCGGSNGEKQIKRFLDDFNIPYEREYKFQDCKDILPLRFDFYLPTYNACIEFDGKQHSKPVDFFGGEEAFEILTKHDQMKDKYCVENHIKLLRIQKIGDIDCELNSFLFE